ncbi:Na/Pi cotransporter family protein [Paenibacillus contaminans]|uniref:Na/Pi cotransporter family protein n=1 Tax=Paenibacillus contaminans TaxID=450362 RepID=A0A329MQK6_9BACL|nr:Na/Pi symporter [Paenibacillus contaminans]RAV21790.1 Na/Pi cotransporter family protein [Paenibacillus contaminans]
MFRSVIIPLLIGLAVFIAGMKVMELSLHALAGNRLQRLLERFTRTPARGMLTSTALTAALQSSSAVTVIAIGLVNAGFMSFPQSLGIILGTNIGTTLTTELLSLDIARYAVPLFAGSAAVWVLSALTAAIAKTNERTVNAARSFRHGAIALSGFACVLLGMETMQAVIPELRERGVFTWLVQQAQHNALWGIAAGAAIAALIHSSAVIIVMAMGLAASQTISPELGIAITIGANVGTCATALVASIGGSRAGTWVAWSHVTLNVAGAVLFYPFISVLAAFTALFASSPGEQVAHAQTLFNLIGSLIALPFCYLPIWSRLKST